MRIDPLYFAREALSNLRRNLLQSLAAVTTVALCLLVVGVFGLMITLGREVVQELEQKVEIEVFLDGVDAPNVLDGGSIEPASGSIRQVQTFEEEIVFWPEVEKVEYISKTQALESLKKDFKDSPEVIESITGNPLPASFRISLENPRDVEKVAKRIKGLEYIEELVGSDVDANVQYGQEVVKRLFSVTRWLSAVAAGFIILLVFVALVLIMNAIRLAIFARRREIGIMKLVGASNWFIRWPFLLEGMLQGLLGAVLAILALYGIWSAFLSDLSTGEVMPYLRINLDQGETLRMVGLLVLAGTLIGAAGSAAALRRFLKV